MRSRRFAGGIRRPLKLTVRTQTMGIEAFVFLVPMLGIGLFLWLAVHSYLPVSRPFALPTLLAALIFAFILVARLDPDKDHYWSALIACFCIGAIVFGLHAHAIRWLVS